VLPLQPPPILLALGEHPFEQVEFRRAEGLEENPR
jgi:hypothetical protein